MGWSVGHGSMYTLAPAPSGGGEIPDASNTGPQTSSLHTVSGGTTYLATSQLPAWTTGAGTALNPYVVARTTYTGACLIGGHDYDTDPVCDWAGKYVKFVDCYFYGSPTTGATDGHHAWGHWTDMNILPANITAEYCWMGPNATPIPAGGPPGGLGGLGYSVFVRGNFTLNNCNIWGAACNLGIVNEGASAPRSYVTNCWLHDQWIGPGDHTESINGVSPTNASNITFDNCMVDGKCDPSRRPNGRVVYGFAIYNDQAVRGWTINNCILKNADVGAFWDSGPPGSGPGSLGNFIMTNNTFDISNMGEWCQGTAAPLTQSNNKDHNGNPLVL